MPVRLTEGSYFGDTLIKGEFSFFSCAVTRYQPFETVKKHYHANSYISILTNGAYVEESGSKSDQIGAGQVIYRPMGYVHANDFQVSGGTCFNVEFGREFGEQIDYPLRLPTEACIYPAGSFPALYRLLLGFRYGLESTLMEELVLGWLSEMSRKPVPLPSLSWIDKVKEILDKEADIHHSIESLARRVFVHPIYLARAFKERTGQTPGEYQLQRKLQNAVRLLLHSSMTVTEIAYTSGFFDAPHLVRTCSFFYGETPLKLRKALKS